MHVTAEHFLRHTTLFLNVMLQASVPVVCKPSKLKAVHAHVHRLPLLMAECVTCLHEYRICKSTQHDWQQ